MNSVYHKTAVKPAAERICPSFKSYFRLMPNQRVRIFFVKRNMPAEVQKYQFGQGRFIMPDAIDLPPDVLKRLGITFYRIHSGYYPVLENEHFIMIDL